MKRGLWCAIVLMFLPLCALTQDKKFQLSAGFGVGMPVWFKNVKKPGYSLKLWLEKNVESERINSVWFACEYTYLAAARTKTELLDANGTTTVTRTFHPSGLATLTIGWRRWNERHIVMGVGAGVAVFTQGVPYLDYSDAVLGSWRGKKTETGWGVAAVGHIGYKSEKFQLLGTMQSVVEPTRFFVNEDNAVRSNVVIVAGMAAIFNFGR